MSGVLAILQGWLASLEALVARAPEGGALLARGSWPAALAAAALGLALLAAGLRVPRVVAFLGGAALGWLAGATIAPAAASLASATSVSAALAAVVGLLCAAGPALYPVLLGALPGGLLGGRIVLLGYASIGSAAGALVLGLFGLLLRRLVLAATAAAVGAALVCAALLAVGAKVPALAVLGRRPLLLVGVGGLLLVAGTAYQLGTVRGAERAPGRDGLGRL